MADSVYGGAVGSGCHLGMCAVLWFLPIMRRVLGSSEGAMLEMVEGFCHVSWHGYVHGVVNLVSCHVHCQVERSGPVGGDDVHLFESCQEMVDIASVGVFYSEVIDYEAKCDIMGGV
jgi:hypothetical protein